MSKEKFTIRNNIENYRNKLGISQGTLSKRSNLAFHTIAKAEADSTLNPRVETVKKLRTL